MTRDESFVNDVRSQTIRLWEAYLFLIGAQTEWNAQDYSNTLTIDPAGSNADVTAIQVGAVVFDTMNAIKASVLDVGHATNLTNLLK